MATLKEIQKLVKADPKLIDKIPNLRDFINQHREDFDFLFKNDSAEPTMKSPNLEYPPLDSSSTKSSTSKKWNPKITQI